MGFYQIFGILVIIFGICLIKFNDFWKNHSYGWRNMKKLQDTGILSKKVKTIISGIVMILLGAISFFKGILF